jgi:ubiquinone biosynthesis protein
MVDYSWVVTLAKEARPHASDLASLLASAISKLNFDPVRPHERRRAFLILIRDIIQMGCDSEGYPKNGFENTVEAVTTIGKDWFNNEGFDADKLRPYLSVIFSNVLERISQNPELLQYLDDYDLISDIAGIIGSRYIPLFGLFPVFGIGAKNLSPFLKEPLFSSLFELREEDYLKLSLLSEKIFTHYYSFSVRPYLEELLSHNARGRMLLLPLVDETIKCLPPEKCMTSLIYLICTPREELTHGRVVSIVLQELGGLYVKLAQVISEIAPVSLAKELRHQQDKLGGIFGSQERSWKYVMEIFRRPSWQRLRHFIVVPETTCASFAGASVGAIYEFALSDLGKKKLRTSNPILIKIQRPDLKALFNDQEKSLIAILERLQLMINQEDLSQADISDLRGIMATLKRSIQNFAAQSVTELDFRREKKNAELVREALQGNYQLKVPRYYHVEADVLIMEKVDGGKVTSVVNSRYLERIIIADLVSDAYLYLMFKKGIIWADPHAGNILYDPEKNEVTLVDLSPCYKWDKHTIHIFVGFLYRLILSDHKGIIQSLKKIVEVPEILDHPETDARIRSFIDRGNQGAFIRYLSEFMRLLGESNINLKIEVQAALRGITQVYLTSSSISSRNSFGPIFQKQFGWKMLLTQILSIGPFKVSRATLPIAFDLIKNSPEEEIGPTLDERDISAIHAAIEQLKKEHVCNIELKRCSPEENSHLLLSTDGSRLIKSAHLRLEILTGTRPASVLYVLEIPSKDWLRERQEYIKLQGMGFALCLVECLEQLRRHSLENYWYVVESWNCSQKSRTHKENELISEVRISARILFQQRFKNLWNSGLMKVSAQNRFLWKIHNWLEVRYERIEKSHFQFIKKKIGREKVGQYTLGSIHRLKIIVCRLLIHSIKSILRRSKFEMNLLPITTNELIDRMIHGLLRQLEK